MSKLTEIPGLGPKTEEALQRLNITQINDLLWHFPSNILYKQMYHPIYSLKEGDLAVLKVRVIDIDQPNNPNFSRRKPFRIHCGNDSGRLQLLYFNYNPQYLLNWLKIDSEIIVIGKIELFNGFKQVAHPEVFNAAKALPAINEEEIIYPLTYGITNKQLQKYINFALENIQPFSASSLTKAPKALKIGDLAQSSDIPGRVAMRLARDDESNKFIEEWIDKELIQKFAWDGFKESLAKIHHPKRLLSLESKERQRLAYDELLATQLMVNLLRQYKTEQQGRSIKSGNELVRAFLESLPFELTNGQQQAIEEIIHDQKSSNKMSRLLQGDVGSGKTVVAMAAMLNAVEAGAQAVLMAPTDVLANQHFLTFEKLCANLPIKYALLTGKTKAKERLGIMEGLASGEIQILIGTHAVFQEKVLFHDLALVVIDEQHRFGVEQRIALVNKGKKADLLIMSATPIPRSLSLALYGDMDITRISEKPKSRIPITTSIMPKSKLAEIITSLNKILTEQGKVYWICPLVNESEDPESQKTSVESRMHDLSKYYPGMVGLVHGQLDAHVKQENLAKFIQGDHRILVATTVIEVGVDVPDATVIIIENAESFGLSQLHQLRGRVGRGDKASHCILLYNAPISDTSWQRLKVIRQHDDGFILAEEDLKLRGSGDVIGTKQSGLPSFKIVDFIAHHQLIALANSQAKKILTNDPELKLASSYKYRKLLEIFGFNELSFNILKA